jgi:hypothetical protein
MRVFVCGLVVAGVSNDHSAFVRGTTDSVTHSHIPGDSDPSHGSET